MRVPQKIIVATTLHTGNLSYFTDISLVDHKKSKEIHMKLKDLISKYNTTCVFKIDNRWRYYISNLIIYLKFEINDNVCAEITKTENVI